MVVVGGLCNRNLHVKKSDICCRIRFTDMRTNLGLDLPDWIKGNQGVIGVDKPSTYFKPAIDSVSYPDWLLDMYDCDYPREK